MWDVIVFDPAKRSVPLGVNVSIELLRFLNFSLSFICIMKIYYKFEYAPLCVHYALVIFYGRNVIFSAVTRDKCFKFGSIPYYQTPYNIFLIKMNDWWGRVLVLFMFVLVSLI